MIRTAIAFAACFAAAAAAGKWSELGTQDFVAISMIFADENHGYIPGGENGEAGVQLFETMDGGKTWNATATVDDGLPLALCVAANPPAVMVGGLFDQYIALDGKNFVKVAGANAQAQDCRYQDGKWFVIGSGLLWGSGITVSTDGKVAKGINITSLRPNDTPRYGAFPSEKAWYVVSGSFPESDDENTEGQTGGFFGQISKSEDAGATWKTQYADEGRFYFNYIDCQDENNCCASAESDAGPAPGSRVWCTTDGQTWNQTYYDDSATVSLMTMSALGDGNYVAGGTYPSGNDIYATFLRSSDNGKTWVMDELSTLPQAALIASSFPTADVGYAMGIDRFNSEILFKYSSSA